MDVRSDTTYRFEHPPEVVWDALARVDAYRSWWPFLRRFEASRLEAGDRWRCTVRPPMPYVLRFTVVIDDVTPPFRIEATMTGDITGSAAVTLTADGDGSVVRLTSVLTPRGRPLRLVSALAPSLARAGHDWVLTAGLDRFRRRALGADPT